MKKIPTWLLYSAYITATTIFFLYYLFPSDKVAKYIEFQFRTKAPEFNIAIGKLKPSFPLGLKLYDINFYKADDLFFNIQQIKATPALLSLLSSTNILAFKVIAYNGIIEGNASVSQNKSAPQIMVETNLSDIQIKDIPALQILVKRNISGLLDGKITYDNKLDEISSAKLTLSDCDIELLSTVFEMENISFTSIETNLVLKKSKLQIEKCTANGKYIEGDITGYANLKRPISKSVLDIRGTIKPSHLFLAQNSFINDLLPPKKDKKNGLSFKINGFIDKPSFSLD